MAQKIEIDVPIFERNLKVFNKKGLRRSYQSVLNHYSEYLLVPPLSSTKDFVLECSIDKEYVEEFQNKLKDMGFTILGSKNTYFVEKLLADFEANKSYFENEEEKMNKIKEEYLKAKEENKEYEVLENEDSVFYFLPYNEGIENLFEFIKTKKDDILAYAKEKDITIMLKVKGFSNQVDGFFGFNFFDADKEGEVVVDFSSNVTVGVDFNYLPAAYSAAVILYGIAESKEDLSDPDLNVHLISENLKYKKA